MIRFVAATLLMTTLSMIDGASARARELDPPSAGQIALALDRLDVVGTVLYVAAHPDDENTRLLAYLANGRGLRAVYLSMTRGDGGQNLVGSDLGPMLGLIRTFELMAARRIDGAEQRFTRAVDFGYSKSSDETLKIWGHDEVLDDVVKVLDDVRPDVVITRFNPEPPNHGHHMASAILAREAFTKAKNRPARLFENKSTWRMKEGTDMSMYLALDVGGYSPELGLSYADLAAASRTMHKSQGFGTATSLGAALEYFEPTNAADWPAKMPGDTKDPFAGLDFTWKRFPKTDALRAAITAAKKVFDARAPEKLVPALAKVRAELEKLPQDNPYRAQKLAELDALVVACLGLDLDARAASPTAVVGEPFAYDVTAVVRRPVDVTVNLVKLTPNVVDKHAQSVVATKPSTPYWLQIHPDRGLFVIPQGLDGSLPTQPSDMRVIIAIETAGMRFQVERPVRYAWVDQVHGERFRPVEVLPPVTVTPEAKVRMFPGGATQTLRAKLRAHGGPRKVVVWLRAPGGWTVKPEKMPVEVPADGTVDVAFEATPGANQPPASLLWHLSDDTANASFAERAIDYLHVPYTTVLTPAATFAQPLDIKIGAKRIGYIAGAGDDVAAALAQVGYDVTMLDAKTLANEDLSRFDAVVAGIRAYNVHGSELAAAAPKLKAFMEAGGTYLVQYTTSNRLKKLDVPVGPYPFTIEQSRVTDETATMKVLSPASPFVQSPNRLDDADFTGWVQERGLYFAETWDPNYSPLFGANDPGEKELQGSVITAKVGKGTYIYTGLAFFRQLPEGVPGAYRLFANLLASQSRKGR